MNIFKITIASFGLPQLFPVDVRNFIVNFLGYTEIKTEGSHHKFKKPGKPNFGCSFNEDGEIKANSGFGLSIKQIGVSTQLFNKYWDNRKEWLKKARINREQTLQEFFSNEDDTIKEIPVHDLTKSIDRLNQLMNQIPHLKKYFQSISQHSSPEDSYENLYQYVINTESLKNAYVKI